MKRMILLAASFVFQCSLFAQNNEPILVKSGTRVIDAIPFAERYQYPVFTKGIITLNDGRSNACLFNLNFLSGKMEFLQGKDTLFISENKDINSIVIAKDTFYLHNTCLQLIRSGTLKVYMSQRIGIVDILKKGAMGTINRTSASENYSFFNANNNSYNLKADEDMVLKKTSDFYFSVNGMNFILFNRKNINKIAPEKNDIVKEYLQNNNIDFKSKTDILKFADFVNPYLKEKKD